MKLEEFPNMWKLKNTVLNNQWVREKTTIKWKILWDRWKQKCSLPTVMRSSAQTFIAMNAFTQIRNISINNSTFHLNEPEKESKQKPKQKKKTKNECNNKD